MDAHLISIGTELVTGQQIDTNTAFLAEALCDLGVRILEHTTVGDELSMISSAISNAHDRCVLVVMTGGLGPTADDLTREALAAALGVPLETDAEALAQVQAFFKQMGREMPASNEVQALIPRGGSPIPNPLGTAPGIFHEDKRRAIFALPGVPGEMKAMFEAAVRPWVKGRTGGESLHRTVVRTFGMSEAKVGELLADLMGRDRNPLVGTTAAGGMIGVRIIAYAASKAEGRLLLLEDVSQIKRRLGSAVIGEGDVTLESAVGVLLKQRGKTLATAESCTGGLLAKRITDIPGSSDYFLRGFVTYANEAKVDMLGVPAELIDAQGAVSGPVARAMASGCRTASGSDYALAITGVAGPSGGSAEKPVGLVYVSLADHNGVAVKELRLGEHWDRSEIRDRSCGVALNQLRLRMMLGQG